MINLCSLFLVIMFVMLMIYAMFESIPITRNLCVLDGETSCQGFVFPAPHIGFCLLLFIPFSMSCFVYTYAAELDVELNYRTMRMYYAENYNQIVSNPQGIYLYDLLDAMGILRKLLLFMTFALCLQRSGMIMIVHVNDTGENATSSVYLEPLGLDNADKYDGPWVDVGIGYFVFIPLFMLVHFVLLCYIFDVFLNWRARMWAKFLFWFLVSAEIVIWIILDGVFYFDFNRYWNENELGEKLSDIVDGEGGKKSYWLPDYGMLLHLIIWFYLWRLWWRIIKAM